MPGQAERLARRSSLLPQPGRQLALKRQTDRQTDTTHDEASSSSLRTATAVGVATIASRKEAPREAATCCWWESISEQKTKKERDREENLNSAPNYAAINVNNRAKRP